jgi:ubiquinone/menaquinone biosynthesis C-methylase UbiE
MTEPLFDRIAWRDPLSGAPLEPVVAARTPGGVPICGAMRIAGTDRGYPIVDSVVRATPELAWRHAEWLEPFGLMPPAASADDFQEQATVDSFGFQWSWIGDMRSEADLRMRVAERFGLSPDDFRGKVVLDAGAGAGDQSRYLIDHGAEAVSIDLSGAIEVVASKLRMRPGWVGVQGDVTMLPLADAQFDVVYCEGVIQHTRDSVATVRELLRVARPGGRILATHYTRSAATSPLQRIKRVVTLGYYESLRRRLSSMERFRRLLVTGNLAALSYVPLLGRLLRRSGTALYYDLMPDFRTTWTNTYDYYGGHAYQRFITAEEFTDYFRRAGGAEIEESGAGVMRARKTT